jgi:hypothetical protein
VCPRTDSHLTYTIDIALTTEFAITADSVAVYSAALHVEQASLARDDDELHPVPRLQLGWQVGHMCLDGPHGCTGRRRFRH